MSTGRDPDPSGSANRDPDPGQPAGRGQDDSGRPVFPSADGDEASGISTPTRPSAEQPELPAGGAESDGWEDLGEAGQTRLIHSSGSIRRAQNSPAGDNSPYAPAPLADPTRAHYTDRFVAPPPEVPVLKAQIPWRRLIVIALAAALIAVASGLVWIRYLQPVKPDPSTVISQSQSPGAVVAASPDEVVREYLAALASGDVDKALSLGPAPSQGSTALLAPSVYARSLQAKPITEIRVQPVTNNSTLVRASYKLGGDQVDAQFPVERDVAGGWRMVHTTQAMELKAPNSAKLPLTIYGVELGTNPIVALLPGFYPVSTGLPFVVYPDSDAVLVQGTDVDGVTTRTLTPQLTSDGEQQLLAAGKASLEACLRQPSLTPPSCPQSLHAEGPYDPSSVRWSVIGDPFATARAALSQADQSIAEVAMNRVVFQVSFRYADGSTNGIQSTEPATISYSSTMVVDAASGFQLRWTT